MPIAVRPVYVSREREEKLMPWWGWLIAFSVVVLGSTMVIVAMVMTGSMRRMEREDDR